MMDDVNAFSLFRIIWLETGIQMNRRQLVRFTYRWFEINGSIICLVLIRIDRVCLQFQWQLSIVFAWLGVMCTQLQPLLQVSMPLRLSAIVDSPSSSFGTRLFMGFELAMFGLWHVQLISIEIRIVLVIYLADKHAIIPISLLFLQLLLLNFPHFAVLLFKDKPLLATRSLWRILKLMKHKVIFLNLIWISNCVLILNLDIRGIIIALLKKVWCWCCQCWWLCLALSMILNNCSRQYWILIFLSL